MERNHSEHLVIFAKRKAQPGHALDHTKAYNAYRLEYEFDGVWSRHAQDANGHQDHYMSLPDGSVWRPRRIHAYYGTAVGKLMMVKSEVPVMPKTCKCDGCAMLPGAKV